MSPGTVLAAVLAGGRSRRYGSEKSAARVGGVPMVARVLGAARDAVGEAVLVASRPVAGAESAPRIADAGVGPLGGLHAALLEARRRKLDAVLLLACDLPLVTPDLLRALVEARGSAPAVAPAREGAGAGEAPTGVEVLCAVWELQVLEAVERRLEGDDLSLQGLFRAVGGRTLPLEELGDASSDALLNVNRPEDRRRAQRQARRRARRRFGEGTA